VRAPAAVITLLLAMSGVLAACVVHDGAGWGSSAPTFEDSGADGVSILVAANAVPGRRSAAVAQRLSERLEATRTAGLPATVLYVGSARGDCDSWSRPGLVDVAHAIEEHEAVGSAWAVRGWRERACTEDGPGGHPGPAYLLELDADGSSRVVSVCDAERGCQLLPPGDHTVARLAVLETGSWFFTEYDDPVAIQTARRLVEAIQEQGEVLARHIATIAVLPLPVESPGVHGQGGRRALSTFRRHPPFVQAALIDGTFEGVISGHERELVVDDDLGRAVKRSSREWMKKPTFQIIAGSAGDAPRVRSRRSGGVSSLPDLRSTRDGFIELRVSDATVDVTVHERVGRTWREGRVSWARHRPAHPVERPSVPLTPCPSCDPGLGAADHRPPLRN
jgi:hypothetical protein